MNIYDFDKTIFNGDSGIEFILFELKKYPRLLKYTPKMLVGCLKYVLKMIDKTQAKEYLYCFLPNVDASKEAIDYWNKNENRFYPYYIKRPDDVIISASPEFILRPIADKMGWTLIASDVDPKTGKFNRPNCYGPEKVIRFRELYPNAKPVNAYSDSKSDLPMLNLAENRWLINKGIPQKL